MIEKMLTVGTANIRASTAEFLDAIVDDANILGNHPYFVVYQKGDYGWIISIPHRLHLDYFLENKETPPELIGLVWTAVHNGCEWLQIDRDATDETLPIWHW